MAPKPATVAKAKEPIQDGDRCYVPDPEVENRSFGISITSFLH